MLIIAAIREAERWTPANILGGLFLLAVVGYGSYLLIRRYLSD